MDAAGQEARDGAQRSAGGPGFRECLAMPPSGYVQRLGDTGSDLDAQMARVLLDYKSGRFQQALKRFTQVRRAEGLLTDLPLIDQLDSLTERQAPLLIFELLFLFNGNETTLGDGFWRYVDAISAFDPDDAICHGALYNVLTLFALRRADMGMADRLCQLADAAYAACGSDYLRGFIHLHQGYIAVYKGQLGAARRCLDAASTYFGTIGSTECERAMVEVTRLWVHAEATGELPTPDTLRPLREQLFAGEFWPECFLVLAALHLRAAPTDTLGLQYLGEIEAVLRIRGMTQLLPVLQLLREDQLRRHAADRSLHADHPDLPEREVLLLLPDSATILTNWGKQAPTEQFAFSRTIAARDLALGERRWREGRLDLAAPLLFSAVDRIEAEGWVWLFNRERRMLADFARDCLLRRRYVEKARLLRDRIAPADRGPEPPVPCPRELTVTEYGIVRRLGGLTNNKLLAREMGVTEAAVKFHLRNIYKKLGVHRRADALTAARSRGWIEASGAEL